MSYDFRIGSTTFTNIKGFKGEHKLSLNESKPTVVLGANGAGKTTILELLFQNVVTSFSGINMQHNGGTMLDVPHISKSTNTGNIDTFFNVSRMFFHVNPYLNEPHEIRFNYAIGGKNKNNDINHIQELVGFKDKLQAQYADNSEFIPLIRFFRTIKKVSYNQQQPFDRLAIEHRWEGYKNCAVEGIQLGDVYNFFIDQTNINNNAKFEKNDLNYNTKIYNYLFSSFSQFIDKIDSNLVLKIDVGDNSRKQNIIFEKDGNRFEFFELSSGEKYIMSLVLELLYRNCILNYDVESLKNVPGIVIIDEIENHLHPKWQAKLLNALQEVFPNVQFIIATHSPLVASTVHSDQLIVLNNFEIVDTNTFNDLHGATSDQILTGYMGASNLPYEYVDFRRNLRQLIADRELEKARSLLNELKSLLKSTPDWLESLETRLNIFLNATNRKK